MVNLHSAHMDPEDWQHPKQFCPERFLDKSGNVIGKDRAIPFSLGNCTRRSVHRKSRTVPTADKNWSCIRRRQPAADPPGSRAGTRL